MASSSYVTCKICKETISYTPGEIWKVGYHLQTKHSKDDIAHFYADEDDGNASSYGKIDVTKRKMYKTTVETWKPSTMELYCSRCKKSALPLTRKQRHKMARSTWGALCLLGCWPLCFLPFMLGRGGHHVNAYCRDCGLLLGTINVKTGNFHQAETKKSVDVPKICVDCECTT